MRHLGRAELGSFVKTQPSQCLLCVCSVTQWCLTLMWPHGLQPTRFLCPWDFPGKNTRVGCHFLLQGIFLTQELNPQPLHWQAASFTTELPEEPNRNPITFFKKLIQSVSQFSHSVVSDFLWSHGLQHARLLCPLLSPGVCSNSCPLSQWCYLSNHLILCCPLLLLPSLVPSIKVFPMSWLFAFTWPKYWSILSFAFTVNLMSSIMLFGAS